MYKHPSPDFHNFDESQISIDIVNLQKFRHLLQSQHTKLTSASWRRRRQIQKVPPQIRRLQGIQQVYDPMMVSIGPYHHGKPELCRAEEFKHLCLDQRAGGEEKKKAFFYAKILDEIAVIRDSYAEAEIIDKYDDESLALMMLLDASMIIDFMHNYMASTKESGFSGWERCLGVGSGPLMFRDMIVMENQIPFRVVKLLIGLQYEGEEAAFLVSRFVSKRIGVAELKYIGIPREEEDPPIHLLEAYWRLMVTKHQESNAESRLSIRNDILDNDCACIRPRSVMDLKAKGIHVRPNSTRYLTDIAFRPNVCFSQLHLPVQSVSALTPVIWSNMIAFEILPDNRSSPIILSYLLFIKSLIQAPEDVKELQEKGVILNRLANLERVVEVYKEIDTFGLHDEDVFKDVKREMEEHCRSRARTWLAELIHTRFRTPWTAMTFFAAGVLLCLTFLQTFFTIRQ